MNYRSKSFLHFYKLLHTNVLITNIVKKFVKNTVFLKCYLLYCFLSFLLFYIYIFYK